MRENHYAIPCANLKISQVSNHKISITLLKILIRFGESFAQSYAKIGKIIK